MAFKKDKAAAQISAFITEDKAEPIAEPKEVKKPKTTKTTKKPIEEKPAAGTPSKGLLPIKGAYEYKTQRVNLLLQPSVYKAAKKQAKQLGFKSFNDYVNELIKAQIAAE